MWTKLNWLVFTASITTVVGLWLSLSNGIAAADVFNMGPDCISLEVVPVGNPGNMMDDSHTLPPHSGIGPGNVDYDYSIGKYEVTASQYCEFLNAVAADDPSGLYSLNMDAAVNPNGCNIKRSGNPCEYVYHVSLDYANRPVNYVSPSDAMRFVNWLNNGQPTGLQTIATTEDGAYAMNGSSMVTRNAGAHWFLPTLDEWHKAAFYDPNKPGYWEYPTGSNSSPGNDLTEQTNPGNNANWNNGNLPIDSGIYYTTNVGEFDLSHSPYGTFDQGGNVAEWIDTGIGTLGFPNGFHSCVGGSFGSGGGFMRGILSLNPLWEEGGAIGFRVVSVPEPSAFAILLSIAICGLLLKKPR